MAILGTKKVVPPQLPNKSIPDPSSRKEGVPFHDFFNLSRVRSPGKSVTSVLEKPVPSCAPSSVHLASAVGSPSPKSAKPDLGPIRSWVAMEEKIIHDPGIVQKVSEKKSPGIASAVSGTLPAKKNAPSPKFFNFFKPGISGKDVPKIQGEPVTKRDQPKVRKPDLQGVVSWIAMEERIVHDPADSFERSVHEKRSKKIKIVSPQVPLVVRGSGPKDKASLGGIFAFLKFRSSRGNPPVVTKEIKQPQEGAVRALPLDLSKVNVTAVKNWVTSEEETVGRNQGPKTSASKGIGLEFKESQKSLPSVPADLMTRITASLPGETFNAKDAVRDREKTSHGLWVFLWVLGWVAAGVLVFFYAREISLTREAEKRSLRLQTEKNNLEQSYTALKSVSDDQAAEMIWLRSQLEDMTWELKGAKADIVKLRSTVRTKDEIVQALKAQTEALEKIIAQQEKAAAVSKAAEVSGGETVLSQAPVVRGQIASINDQRGFIVVDMGSSQGVHSGQWIMITRFDKNLGFGRVDRVYPNMSVALLRDREMFQAIREGDSVFFS